MADSDISLLDRCSGRQIKELLALASAEAKLTPNSLGEIGDSAHLGSLLTDICTATDPTSDALLEAVCSPASSVEALIAIKSTAKRFVSAAQTPAQKDAATLLYHVAVAAALGRFGRNISSMDVSERLPLYKDLAAELTDEKLASIFEKAALEIRPASH